ncbi:MAG: D-glycero-beta-D-manno-heptose 1,7-bisphosphate 7-phosphatase [Pseudomonadota bacterium]
MSKPVVFLDRDGVINMDSADYIKTPAEFQFIPNSPEAIALLCQHGFNVIVITNQSMIGRNMVTQDTLDAIFNKMKQGVNQAGGRIKDIFFCPHIPGAGCGCRKPEPGLILKARAAYDIDLSASIMVGDSAKDIETGINAGCGKTVLVRTGNGNTALDQLTQKKIIPDHVAADLYTAVQWIINPAQQS